MVLSIGIDSGTKTMDIYGFNDKDGSTIVDIAIPRDQITQSAKLVVEKLREVQANVGKIDAIVGPSGYGMQLETCKASLRSRNCPSHFYHGSGCKTTTSNSRFARTNAASSRS